MRIIDRLAEYLNHKKLTNYAFEHQCGLANGYLAKQMRGKGSIGSEILKRILDEYVDLSLIWLVYGRGPMLKSGFSGSQAFELQEDQPDYRTLQEERIEALRLQVELLQAAIADKNKIIGLLEKQAQERDKSGPGAAQRAGTGI